MAWHSACAVTWQSIAYAGHANPARASPTSPSPLRKQGRRVGGVVGPVDGLVAGQGLLQDFFGIG